MERERGAGGGEGGKRLARRHGRGAAAGARQHQRLRHLRQGQLALQRRGGGGEGGHAGRQRIGNAERVEAAELLADRAPHREVAGMKPRHVMAGFRCAASNSATISSRLMGAVSTMRAPSGQSARISAIHQRAGIEADRAARDEVGAAKREEVRRAGAGADEMHGHGAAPCASAQVTPSPLMRGQQQDRACAGAAPGPRIPRPRRSRCAFERRGGPASPRGAPPI